MTQGYVCVVELLECTENFSFWVSKAADINPSADGRLALQIPIYTSPTSVFPVWFENQGRID